jgi:uncharacterized protein YndB with AHSA1/START domain
MKLTSKASIQIQKPIDAVFEGIVNPEMITNYFISYSSGRLETGKTVYWSFPEFEGKYPIKDVTIEDNDYISFVWDPDTVVTINLRRYDENSTIVEVTEGAKEHTPENLNWLISNTGGWANFLACMKAYLEYGISLRKGAYDFMAEK